MSGDASAIQPGAGQQDVGQQSVADDMATQQGATQLPVSQQPVTRQPVTRQPVSQHVVGQDGADKHGAPKHGAVGHSATQQEFGRQVLVPENSTARPRAPFSPKELARLDEAISMSSAETGLYFTVYVGALDVPTRGSAARLHAQLGSLAPQAVVIAVSPGQGVVEVVTGIESGRRLPDRACSLAVLSMTAAFGAGDLTGGLVTGMRMLSDQAGHLG
ncbi:MAG: DUF5130 family protein [Mycobacteriales bacterium]